MLRWFGPLTIVLLFAMVLTRVQLLRSRGTAAMKFGELDKTDFLIPPFAIFYFYVIIAGAFDWPSPVRTSFELPLWVSWLGVLSCAIGLIVMLLALISFGTSFRVGIDVDHPGALVTSGIFAVTRNPIYVAFAFILLGEFLLFPNWVLAFYLIGGIALFHRQVLREEAFLATHYGAEFSAYCKRVRRYL
ncbi:MAG: isoprenylcysteine carboxylmethyltransferase family protein [Candidatus Cybelea sp.]